MSLEAASIAQHCKALRLSAIQPSSPRWRKKPANRTTPTYIIWKRCCNQK